jgi:hypothetical protein
MYLIYPDLSNSDRAKINSFVDSTLRDITLDRIIVNWRETHNTVVESNVSN